MTFSPACAQACRSHRHQPAQSAFWPTAPLGPEALASRKTIVCGDKVWRLQGPLLNAQPLLPQPQPSSWAFGSSCFLFVLRAPPRFHSDLEVLPWCCHPSTREHPVMMMSAQKMMPSSLCFLWMIGQGSGRISAFTNHWIVRAL